jgi:hypothetical protein
MRRRHGTRAVGVEARGTGDSPAILSPS